MEASESEGGIDYGSLKQGGGDVRNQVSGWMSDETRRLLIAAAKDRETRIVPPLKRRRPLRDINRASQ